MSSAADVVGATLEGYARRGVFRGFGRLEATGGRVRFQIRWHHDRLYECVFDRRYRTLRFPRLLPDLDESSGMVPALRAYVRARQAGEMPEHRRIDPAKFEPRLVRRDGALSVGIKILGDSDQELEEGTRRLIHLVHEIFLDFLRDGRYYDYLVEVFGMDEDPM